MFVNRRAPLGGGGACGDEGKYPYTNSFNTSACGGEGKYPYTNGFNTSGDEREPRGGTRLARALYGDYRCDEVFVRWYVTVVEGCPSEARAAGGG